MGIKKSLIFSAILVIVLLVSILLISCGPAAGPSGEGDPQSGEELTQEEIADLEEAIEEEIIEVVDYDNALIGAELYGYMPSYLCTNSDNYIKVIFLGPDSLMNTIALVDIEDVSLTATTGRYRGN